MSGKMSSFIIPSNRLYCRGEKQPRFENQNVGTHLEVEANVTTLSLVHVKINKLPKRIKLNSLTIESSYIQNYQSQSFLDNVKINKIIVKNSDIDSIFGLGLFKTANDVETLREESNANTKTMTIIII